MQLDEQRFARIDMLCRRGDELLEGGDLDGALASYEKAWQQIPEPRAAWVVSTWVLSALADVYFYQGDYPRALQALRDAMLCPDGWDNPYLRLRLGQVHLELGDEAQAREALRQALAAGGGELFEGDDAKYLAFARSG
ncbi:MAG: hypothetical protein B0D96_12920 [Candidatus Sedimenticola endophacoides]|uniref:Uncharacterized protein n=1 Tax=Candidatus Sedimenticola endophacoides TaxID=2548426 RepID=A0A6N4E145_9GAMM|nr:MAG: hypothetical protein B0D94_00835 [Candidatus Sedimenticola endophacoides]OQX32820.1 MAG: hypothetical protein B0D96_12920 [Candidatus Sedimenticola endophacoides]OQX39135.1 MAG: hypothetical protein B0D88_09650 [Candidatus Sedimenticola endophacoides]OQX42656.1 MAG: hypothetical protein B0D89_00800 [Candidatus Sedimenticola endophacoides]PUD99962.1 MAG: hypothetical protein C3L26_07150 [Candidatus Sedimenticola endophacoides]